MTLHFSDQKSPDKKRTMQCIASKHLTRCACVVHKWMWAFWSEPSITTKETFSAEPELLCSSHSPPFSAQLCDHVRHNAWSECLACLFILSTGQLQSNHPKGHHSSYNLLLVTVSEQTEKELRYTHLSVYQMAWYIHIVSAQIQKGSSDILNEVGVLAVDHLVYRDTQ